ncbi:hypothetical protein [Curtobacterium sp. MCBD17_028]|uniref:hypothetical protein n=1 Tax=Curtobacterium sp. MCBD17_028 TaxID=2175670 RepID=UPI000DA74D5F|nr:hypothetical protein [Curtobacterium sp. MCBD17_028]PZE23885.1 hypothetical protein DEI86_13660 [Curtobacterium sp. MCBD17_028]
MPTGYTEALYKGDKQTFEQFAMKCARAFGALVELRDEPNALIPECFEVSEYERRRLDEAVELVVALKHRSPEDWSAAQDAEVAEHNEHVRTAIQAAGERRIRYEQMLAQVRGWTPPTSEHEGMRDFMVEQLTTSIKFDCSTSYLDEQRPLPVDEYALLKQDKAAQELERAEQSWRDAKERADARTCWVRALRESLGVRA